MRIHAPVTKAVLYDVPAEGVMAALTESRPFGMLPLANRPLLHHLISQLAEFGIREIDLFTAAHHEQAAAYVAEGERWGVQLRCHRQAKGCKHRLPPEVVTRMRGRRLFMRIDCWPGKLAMRAFLLGSGHRNRQLLGEAGSLPCYCADAEVIALGEQDLPMVFCYTAYQLDTPAQYLRANLEVLARLDSDNPPEQPLDNGLYIGAGCRISENARFEGSALLGAGGHVGRGVQFGPHVVAGNRVFLDAGCKLKRCVVLDGTYIGPDVRLHGKIVDGNRIIDCRNGEISDLANPVNFRNKSRKVAERKLAKGVFRWLTARKGVAA